MRSAGLQACPPPTSISSVRWPVICTLSSFGEMSMKEEEKLAADEAQRITQHESVKGEVREKVHADITRQADRHMPAEQRHTEALAASLERKAVREVATTEAELERGQAVARASQVVDYLFY